MQALVTADELVGEAKAGHETTLLEPEDGAEGAGEEDALDGGKGDASLGEGGIVSLAPLQSPASLALDAGDGLDGIQQMLLLVDLLDVGVDEQRVGFRVNVLNGNLEAVEAPGLGTLDLGGKVGGEILVDDTVGGGEEGEDVTDEVTLIGV